MVLPASQRVWIPRSVCFDCLTPDPDWASVNHGTLVCLRCAGRHRALGVHISTIKSLNMDAWEPQHVIAMILGGNAQLKGFFTRQKIENYAIEYLYVRTRAADFYRKKLKEQVRDLNGDLGLSCLLFHPTLPPPGSAQMIPCPRWNIMQVCMPRPLNLPGDG